VDLLLAVVSEQIDYVPALTELQLAWSSLGEAVRARRVGQVVDLATGNGSGSGSESSALLSGPISKEVWTRLTDSLARHPLEPLWQLLSDSLERRFPVNQPRTVPFNRPDVILAASQVGRLFDRQVELVQSQEPGPLWRIFGHWMILSHEVADLDIADHRYLLGLGHTATRSGHAGLMCFPPDLRVELARTLASVLLPEAERPREIMELLAGLSRKEQRQVARLVSQHGITKAGVDDLAQAWLTAVEKLGIQVALLITDELGALVRILAMQQGIPASWLVDGGLLTALPDLDKIVEYYLSDAFHDTRTAIQA
jgi:hypothetical protein